MMGVLQRFVLRPLILFVYMDDFPSFFQFPAMIYVDDVKLWSIIQTQTKFTIIQNLLFFATFINETKLYIIFQARVS